MSCGKCADTGYEIRNTYLPANTAPEAAKAVQTVVDFCSCRLGTMQRDSHQFDEFIHSLDG